MASSSSKDTASWRKKNLNQNQKDQIHFVNARPSSETEKLKIQRMVRAHVGKWISDQTRDRSAEGSSVPELEIESGNIIQETGREEGPHDETPGASRVAFLDGYEGLSRSSSSPDVVESSSHSSSESNAPVVVPGSSSEQRLVHRPVVKPRSHTPHRTPTPQQMMGTSIHDNPHTYNHNQEVARSRLPTPSIDRVGVSAWDPFHTYPSRYSPEFIRLHEGYSLSVVWPFLTPDSPNGLGIIGNSTWFPLSLTDATLFTAFLFSSLSHQCARWRNRSIPDGAFKPQDLRTLQMVEIETIKLINEAVQDPARAASDAVLLSVLCMAHNTSNDSSQQRADCTPFTAPLQRLQWLDVYGSLPPNLVHVQGLIQMVMLRGGIEKIELPGLASILSFSDILTASSYLSRPVFAWMPLEKHRRGHTLQTLLNFTPLDVDHGFGRFRDLGFTAEMAETFQAARVYTNIIQDYLKGKMVKPDLTMLVDQRNLVHYTILSLPSATELQQRHTYRTHEIIYETCRLAALIYGVGVVFPIPSGSTPLPDLARLIQTILQCPTSSSIWDYTDASTALTWVLALGGIAAENLPERTWFVSALGHTARQNRISCWNDFHNAVGTLLWCDAACEQPGQRLWLEVARSFQLSC